MKKIKVNDDYELRKIIKEKYKEGFAKIPKGKIDIPRIKIDVSDIDVSEVESFAEVFLGLNYLVSITGLETWNTSNVIDMHGMFDACYTLENLEGISNWDVSNVTDMEDMFYECSELECVDLSGWDITKLKDSDGMFFRCSNLKEIKGIENFSFKNLKKFLKWF